MSTPVLLITPSHGPDFHRCCQLVASVDRFVSGIDEHWLLVDRADYAQFAPLQAGRTRVLCTAEVLPCAVKRLPGSDRWWWVSGAGLVRGWILQQVVKLAVARISQAPVLWFADSDTVFFRSFNAQTLLSSQGVRLFREPRRFRMWRDKRYLNWYELAARYSGVSGPDEQEGGYIAQLNAWRHDAVLRLHERVEAVNGLPWAEALLRCSDFSEFILYGCFAEYFEQGRGHEMHADPLCLSSWYHHLPDAEALWQLRHHVQPHHVALHIQSNLGMAPQDYARLLQAIQQEWGHQP